MQALGGITPSVRSRLALVAWLALLAAPAYGAGRTSSLSWVRAPEASECVVTGALAAAVEHELGRAVFVPPARAAVSIEGLATKQASRYAVSLVLRDSAGKSLGTRTLQGEANAECAALTPSIVLAIALMIDPDAELGATPAPNDARDVTPTPTPPPPAIPPAPPAPTTAPHPAPPPVPARRRASWYGEAGVEAGLALGLVESHSGQVSVSGLLRAPFGGALAGGVSFLPSRDLDDEAGVVRARSIGWTAYLDACPLAMIASRALRPSLALCAGARGGAFTLTGTQLDRPRRESYAFGGPEVAASSSVRLVGALALRARVAAFVPVRRPSALFEDSAGTPQTLDRMGPVVPSFELGLGWVFR